MPTDSTTMFPDDNARAFETSTVKGWLAENGITWIVVHPGSNHDLEDAKENVEKAVKINHGRQDILVLVDIRQVGSTTKESRKYYAGINTARNTKAVALIIGSPISRMIGNFFMGFDRDSIRTKLFSDEATALEWLKGFQK